jgi:hypothetical protein
VHAIKSSNGDHRLALGAPIVFYGLKYLHCRG